MSFEIKGNKVIIKDPLVDIEQIFDLATKLGKIDSDRLIIDMINNYSLPSTLIGQLRFLKDKGVNIEIWVYNDLLYSLFKDFGLTDLFEIKKK